MLRKVFSFILSFTLVFMFSLHAEIKINANNEQENYTKEYREVTSDEYFDIAVINTIDTKNSINSITQTAYFAPKSELRSTPEFDEVIFSSSFRLYIQLVIDVKSVGNEKIGKFQTIIGGYEQLDPTCEFLDSVFNYYINGLTTSNNLITIQDTYFSGTDTYWASYNVSDDYISLGSEEDALMFTGCYVYDVSHAGNADSGSWCMTFNKIR